MLEAKERPASKPLSIQNVKQLLAHEIVFLVGIAIFFWLFFRILQSSFFLFKNFRFSDIKEAVTRFCLISDSVSQI
ncbi:hypothetical protein WN943_011314 [Citrus x changshan-huyou]